MVWNGNTVQIKSAEFRSCVWVCNMLLFSLWFPGRKVIADCLNLEDNDIAVRLLTMEDFVMATTGSKHLPLGLNPGLITFDHNSSALSSVNTCGPSITFSQTPKLVQFGAFQTAMLNIIIGSPGFGQV